MTAELDGRGDEAPDQEPEPTEGLRLRALPAISDPAFPLHHDYFEIVYTPLIGPTGILLARAMARHLEDASGPTTVCPIELSHELGIRASNTDPLGKKSHLVHAIDRLVHDHIITHLGDRTLGVRTAVPALSSRALAKLPAVARAAHRRVMGSWRQDPS